MTIRIRTFKPSDSDFIASLVTRFSEFDLPAWRSASEVDHTNRILLQKVMEQPEPDSMIFVAEDENGRQAGFIHLQTQTDYFNGEKHGYISDLAVDKSFEGQGVGRMLVDQAEEWGLQKGYHFLTLYVFAGNQRAQRMYERNGFYQEVIKYVKVIKPGSQSGNQ
jgi:ribosomal protein S18 acetylase RimI-like enzyme